MGRKPTLEKLSPRRQKLGQKAKQEPKFRLYDRIYRSDILEAAIARVRGNDGVTFEQIETREGGLGAWRQGLQEELRTKRYSATSGSARLHPEGEWEAAAAGDTGDQRQGGADGRAVDPGADF